MTPQGNLHKLAKHIIILFVYFSLARIPSPLKVPCFVFVNLVLIVFRLSKVSFVYAEFCHINMFDLLDTLLVSFNSQKVFSLSNGVRLINQLD